MKRLPLIRGRRAADFGGTAYGVFEQGFGIHHLLGPCAEAFRLLTAGHCGRFFGHIYFRIE